MITNPVLNKFLFTYNTIPIVSSNRLISKKPARKVAFKPVELAYASYEGTGTLTENEPPPLIIMHGLLGSKANWNSLSKAYQQKTSPQRKVIAVDARNHGDSPHDPNHTYEHLIVDIKALLEKLGITRGCFLGHSMGGRTMMLLALKYPQLIEKLIIVDISPINTSPDLRSTVALMTALKNINIPNNIPISRARLAADLELSQTVNSKILRSFLLTNLIQQQDGSFGWRVNLPALISNFVNIAEFPHVKETFDGPVLFIAGGSSDYLKTTDYSDILKLFPKAQFKSIPGAGHWLHSEKPNEFLQLSIDFLNKS